MSFGVLALTSLNNPVTVTTNSVTLTAGHNEAVNRLTVTATNLTGGGAAVSPGSTYDTPSTTTTVNTDFSVSNLQNALGLTTTLATPALTGVNIADTITGGTMTVTGNSVNANAKTNNATNELAINATNIAAPSAAVANGQSADGAVTSTQALVGPATFGVLAGTSAIGTALTVSSNVINVTARQNDASSALNVTSANVSGSTAGTGLTSYDPVGAVATSGAAYSVLNVQSGTGAISATANPGVIGTVIGIIDAGSVTVNSNSVTAKADVNNAANTLNLAAGSAVSATGAINNVQTTSATAVTGTVNGGYVGVNSGVDLSPGSLTVQGNSLASQAGGNSASNVLNGTAGSSLAASANNPTLLVLNYQTNLASATALTTTGTIGVTGFTSLTGTPTSIVGNTLSAYGYGNTATNQLGMSVLAGGLNQATAMTSNTQFNNGAIGATVTTATIGVGGGIVTGGSVVVSNNTAVSQATANSAVNRIIGR
jgi:hypothetical protein